MLWDIRNELPQSYRDILTLRSYPTLTTSHCPSSDTTQQSLTTSLEL